MFHNFFKFVVTENLLIRKSSKTTPEGLTFEIKIKNVQRCCQTVDAMFLSLDFTDPANPTNDSQLLHWQGSVKVLKERLFFLTLYYCLIPYDMVYEARQVDYLWFRTCLALFIYLELKRIAWYISLGCDRKKKCFFFVEKIPNELINTIGQDTGNFNSCNVKWQRVPTAGYLCSFIWSSKQE